MGSYCWSELIAKHCHIAYPITSVFFLFYIPGYPDNVYSKLMENQELQDTVCSNACLTLDMKVKVSLFHSIFVSMCACMHVSVSFYVCVYVCACMYVHPYTHIFKDIIYIY